MPIQILPDEIASQIAAGEVVERPASVVKELLENAIDAEAKHINIIVKEAGKGLIELSDDGTAISAQDLPLAIARHATSKLSTAEELFQIETLGFRGEALASIGSVSRLSIISRTREANSGLKIVVEGGHAKTPQPIGAPAGTVVRVEDLFFNVPARKSFLRTDRTERRQIDILVNRYALAYPEIRFQLLQEERISLQTSGKGDRREVVASIYGVETAKNMIEVVSEDENLQVTGFISPTTLTRSNRSEIHFFVNGRPIQDASLTTALVQAYHTMLMVGRYPMAVLFIKMPPNLVDVNVHPTKAEVRFRDRNLVFRAIGRAARKALLAHTPVSSIHGPNHVRWSPNWGAYSSDHKKTDPTWEMANDLEYSTALTTTSGEQNQPSFSKGAVPLLRLIGQVALTYLIAEGPDGLYLIDQHAAHERVLFERLMSQKESEIPSQTLLEPVTVEMSIASARLIEDQLKILNDLGFRVDNFGTNMFIIRGIPTLLSNMEPSAALMALVEDFEEDETPLKGEIEAKIVARICKKAAVKAGMVLSSEEQKVLLTDLESCQAPRTCPHGRPTMIHLSVELLEKQFGRRG